jgi:hypothetical protein
VDRLAPLPVYKLLLGQLVRINPYYRLCLGYAPLRFYYITFNINRARLYPLYEFRLVLIYYK